MDAFDSSIFDVEAGENGVVVQLDGTSPNIMINISNCIDSDNPLSKVDYSIEGDEMELGTYKNGDEITIVATLPKNLETEVYGMIHVTNLKRTPDGGLEIGEFYIYEDCYPSEAAFEEAVINEKASDFTISEKALNE